MVLKNTISKDGLDQDKIIKRNLDKGFWRRLWSISHYSRLFDSFALVKILKKMIDLKILKTPYV